MLIRKNVFDLGKAWADPVLWYARGVKALQARPLDQSGSWGFYGAIHGMDEQRWKSLGIPTAPLPKKAVRDLFWDQCQHGSWYFLPWHRGYLYGFEKVVRQAIVGLGGPADWTLPYWNYFGAQENLLPPAFAFPEWPDGKDDNPLYTPYRYGPDGDGKVYVPMSRVNEKALKDAVFEGAASSARPGFGGKETGFSHSGSGSFTGGIESQPHNMVHVLVGFYSRATNVEGLMTDPNTAGLDPIFWLHHANIDRLWAVWNASSKTHTNPTNPLWLNGPAGRRFVVPLPNNPEYAYTPRDMVSTEALGYTYDDLSAPPALSQALARVQRLVSAAAPAPGAASPARTDPMATSDDSELLGATQARVSLVGAEAHATVRLDPQVRAQVSRSLRAVGAPTQGSAPAAAPNEVFLHLENVRGNSNAIVFDVYVGLSPGADPAEHPENKADTIALFGVVNATAKDGRHAGDGLNFALDITHIVDDLHLRGNLDGASGLDVRFVPLSPVSADAQISIGRISVYRQAG